MKCVCGYEYDYNFIDGEKVVITGDKPFINSGLWAVFEIDDDYYPTVTRETIYICPKCGTLKIEV